MRVQLVLAALVSLATAFYYPSISDDQDHSQNHHDYNRQGRYLWINQSNTSPYYSLVMNMTTIAIGMLTYGSVGLGLWSVLAEADNALAKKKALKAKLQVGTGNDDFDDTLASDFEYDLSEVNSAPGDQGSYSYSTADEAEILKYEKELKEYEPVSYTHLTLPTILRV